jgi:hypothetical protein
MEEWSKIATASLSEQLNIVNTQRGVFSDEVTQRGQTLKDTESRRNFSTNAMSQALDFNKQTAPYLSGDARGKAGDAFLGQLMLSNAMASMVGGMRESPEIKRPPAVNQVMGAQLGGGMPQAPGVTIINQPPAAAPVAEPQMSPSAPALETLIPSFQGGLSFAGGGTMPQAPQPMELPEQPDPRRMMSGLF